VKSTHSTVSNPLFKDELREHKVELHLDGKMVVNVRPYSQPSYWSDLFFMIFNKDHFLSMFYCHHEHPFTKIERIKVYFAMFATAALLSTCFMPPEDCESWINPQAKGEYSYDAQHTPGRIDVWTGICASGMSAPNAKSVAVAISSVVKVFYGSFLEYLAFCPCFVDYVGAFKDRTESAGAIVLNTACILGVLEIVLAVSVLMNTSYRGEMLQQIVMTVLSGIITGWISVWVYYHLMRSIQTGCRDTFQKCAHGVDDADGDGIECCEVIRTMRKAWNDQKDLRAYADPDTKDGKAVPNMSFSARQQDNGVSASSVILSPLPYQPLRVCVFAAAVGRSTKESQPADGGTCTCSI
jgi:hypothetical protein